MLDSQNDNSSVTTMMHKRPTLNPSPNTDDHEVDLGELIGVLIENRWLILVIAIAITVLGGTYGYTTAPVYRADALLQVEEKKSGLGDLDINQLLGGDAPVIAEIEILRSRFVIGKVVDKLNLDLVAKPEYFPVFGAALARNASASERPGIKVDSLDVSDSVTGTQFALVALGSSAYELFDQNDNLLLQGKVGELAQSDTVSLFVSKLQADVGQRFLVYRRSRISSIRSLQARLSVSERGVRSGILSISLEGDDPESVQRQVDGIADAYVEQNVGRKAAEAKKTLAFLDEQLPAIEQEMESAEDALNAYRLEKGSVDLPLETQGILETIVSVEAQLNQLRRERDKTIQAFTPLHPTVVALDRQIESLNAEIVDLNAQVRELPSTQQEVLRLVRDVEVNTVLYTSLLNTAQELRVVEAGTVGNVRIIDDAVAQYTPIRPRKGTILVLSFLLGGFLGVAAAFVRKAMRAGVEDPDLVEKHLNIPVYATISHSSAQVRISDELESKKAPRKILAIDSPDDPAIESLKNLRTALHFGMMDVKNKCIMISGPSPEVGKSFVSVNLAAVLTSNEKKVLLIDGDLRRGHLHKYLGLHRENGLSDFISGTIPIGEALHQTSIPGLSLIPTGSRPPNPSELLLHQRFANCMSVLMPRFDHIIIDSPPILAVTDATIIGQMAGATLMVLKSGEHPMREIEQAAKRLQQSGVNLRGVLINDVSLSSQRYGPGKYSYQYAYGNG